MNRPQLLSYGAYLPRHRLARSAIGKGAGARAVASHDEDAITMGVAALRQIGAAQRRGQAMYFATATPPYWDKSNAGTVATACALGAQAPGVDLAGLRSGMDALRIAAHSSGLAVLSDLRTGRPGSSEEAEGGDGAAAFLFGQAGDGGAVAELLGQVSLGTELMDIWRQPGSSWACLAEDRFASVTLEGLAREAVATLLAQTGITQAPTQALVSCLNGRLALSLAQAFKPAQAPAPLKAHRAEVGYCGAADPGLLLASALDQARAGDTLLLVCAAGGVDAMLWRVLKDGPARQRAEQALPLDYVRYLTWRGLLQREPARRPERATVSSPASFRNQAWKFGLTGTRCTVCGAVHLPGARVCAGCGAIDQSEAHDVSERRARVASFSTDLVSDSPASPAQVAVIDFEGGGRVLMEMTDTASGGVQPGDAVQMSFRRTYAVDGTPNYFWKAVPSAQH